MDNLKHEIRAAFARQQAGLGDPGQAPTRLLRDAVAGSRRPNVLLSIAGGAATLAVAAAILVAVLLTRGHLQQNPAVPNSVEEALTAGPAAVSPGASDRLYVWLTGHIVKASAPGQSGGQLTGTTVAVLDWTGKVRYHFDLTHAAMPNVPIEIQAISADGTRALLGDGTVIDQTGAMVGKLALTLNGMSSNGTHWMADDQHVCASFSNEPVAPYVAPKPKGQPNVPSPPPQPYTSATADHSVTLKVFGLDGSVRTVATVGQGPQGTASGPMGDSTSVLSCNRTSDLAVIVRYHDADTSGSQQGTTNMQVSLWAIKLSTGAIIFHQPETRMALGRAFFFGSQNGQLAVEFLWNSKVWGAETDVVLRMPSGQPVPVLDVEPAPDTPGLSADGTRILRRIVDAATTKTSLELIDASNGHVIRRIEIPTVVGASAVAYPGGSTFMVQVQNYLALVDSNGGISLLHPNVNLGNGPGSVGLPPYPLQN